MVVMNNFSIHYGCINVFSEMFKNNLNLTQELITRKHQHDNNRLEINRNVIELTERLKAAGYL